MSEQPSTGQATTSRDAVGTIYRTPQGALYVVAKYSVPIAILMSDEYVDGDLSFERAEYHYLSPRGGASHVTTLEPDAVKIWAPAPEDSRD